LVEEIRTGEQQRWPHECDDRPAVEPRTVDLEELLDRLTTFDELGDKRQARDYDAERRVVRMSDQWV
jgi:hypothetical protein